MLTGSSDSDCILYNKDAEDDTNEGHLFLDRDLVGSNDDESRLEDTLRKIQRELNYSVLQGCFLKRSVLSQMVDHPRFCEFAEGSFVGILGQGEPLLSRIHKCFLNVSNNSWQLEAQVLEAVSSAHDDSMSVSDQEEGNLKGTELIYYEVRIQTCMLHELSDKMPDGSSLTEFLRRLAISTKGTRGSNFRTRSQAIVTLFPRALDEPHEIGQILEARVAFIKAFTFTETDVAQVLNDKKKEHAGPKSLSTINLEIEREEIEGRIRMFEERSSMLEKAMTSGAANSEMSDLLAANKKQLKRSKAERRDVLDEIKARKDRTIASHISKPMTLKPSVIKRATTLPTCLFWESRLPMSSFNTGRVTNPNDRIAGIKSLFNRIVLGTTTTSDPTPLQTEPVDIPPFDPLAYSYVCGQE